MLITTIVCATCITTTGFLIAQLFPNAFIVLFTSDQELLEICRKGIRIVFIFFPIVGFQMVTGNFFQSVGMAGKAIFLSMSRQVLFLIPLLLTLPSFFGADGVWWSMPISDALSSIVATFLLLNQIKKLKNHNSDGI